MKYASQTVLMTVPEIARAKAAGRLVIHDNGTLTYRSPGGPEVLISPIHTMNGHLRRARRAADARERESGPSSAL